MGKEAMIFWTKFEDLVGNNLVCGWWIGQGINFKNAGKWLDHGFETKTRGGDMDIFCLM